MYYISEAISASIAKVNKKTAESKQTADNFNFYNFSHLTTLDSMREVVSLQFLNFLNFGDEEKWLVGLRQAVAAGKNLKAYWTQNYVSWDGDWYRRGFVKKIIHLCVRLETSQ